MPSIFFNYENELKMWYYNYVCALCIGEYLCASEENNVNNDNPSHIQAGNITLPNGEVIDIDDPSIEVVKAKSGNNRPILIAVLVVIALAAVYALGIWFFGSHYFFRTRLDGAGVGLRSKVAVRESLVNKDMTVDFILVGAEAEEYVFNSHDADMAYVVDEDKLMAATDYRGALAWPKYLFVDNSLPVDLQITYDEDKLRSCISSFPIYGSANYVSPVNAFIGEFDDSTGKYSIVPDVNGTAADVDATIIAIKDRLRSLTLDDTQIEINLKDSDCYEHADILADSEVLLRTLDAANRCMSADIIYDWNGAEVRVDNSIVRDWISFEGTDLVIDEDAVKNFVANRAYENDTFGRKMQFMCNDGQVREITRGGYGWKTATGDTTKDMIDAVIAGTVGNREPIYTYSGYVHGQNDVGDSYVEIDLSKQHLWLYIDGEIEFETDFVSGNVINGNSTPEGIYGITYKEKEATLRGATYESHVHYWMPFNGNVGMHDATWRSEFGGLIYLTSGSHGCVNLPYASAATIYDYMTENFPVVCYYEAYPLLPDPALVQDADIQEVDEDIESEE